MTVQDLKTILINHLDSPSGRSRRVNQEVLDLVIPEDDQKKLAYSEAAVFQIEGTTVILSDAGLVKPERIVFLDLQSRKSVMHEIEG